MGIEASGQLHGLKLKAALDKRPVEGLVGPRTQQ